MTSGRGLIPTTEEVLQNAGAFGAHLGFGSIAGYAAGKAMRAGTNIGLVLAGAGFITAQMLQQRGYIQVDWNKVENEVRAVLDVDGDGELTTTDASIAWDGIVDSLRVGVPGSAGFAAGALAGFGGVKRRFTRTGEWNGATIFDDYGHHPVEIKAVLKAARASTEHGVIAVVQPHRYTRLQSLFDDFCTCFNDADTVIVAPVYAAGEQPLEGFDRDSLVAGLRSRGHRDARALERPEELAGIIAELAKPGDYVVCLGAGTITQWAYALPDELAARGR